jgi:hypothetical protein
VPAFSIQRTQFVLKLLLENYDKFPEKQIYLSSELSNQVNQLFLSRKREKYAYLADKRIKVL